VEDQAIDRYVTWTQRWT